MKEECHRVWRLYKEMVSGACDELERVRSLKDARISSLRSQLKSIGAEMEALRREMSSDDPDGPIADSRWRKYEEGGVPPLGFLYRLIDNGEVVYVGKANSVMHRVKQHRDERIKEFDEVEWRIVPGKDMRRLEREEILRIAPIYNNDHNGAHLFLGKRRGDAAAIARRIDYLKKNRPDCTDISILEYALKNPA